jgi:DNA invertase Pin-like site-specific DNA recombinase
MLYKDPGSHALTSGRRRRPGQLRAVVYARVSTVKRSQSTSIPRQLAELRTVCRRWRLVASESDRETGGRDDRPGLQRALEHVRRGRADILVVHDIDRLGRDVRSMLANVDAIHASGGHFFLLDRSIDTSTPEGRLTFTILAALAEWQRRNLRERVIAGLAHARKKGVILGRRSTIPPAALARAVVLRRQRPRPSWSAIVSTLAAEKLGRVTKGAISSAVTLRLKTPSNFAPRMHGKTRVPQRHLRAV